MLRAGQRVNMRVSVRVSASASAARRCLNPPTCTRRGVMQHSITRKISSPCSSSSSSRVSECVSGSGRRAMHSSVPKHTVKPKLDKITSTPPLPIRLALVGSSVTLATPLFTVAGLYRIWTARSVLPAGFKWAVTAVIGGSTFTLFYKYIIPNIWEYSHILLPFAVSNGVACMAWQGLGEAVLGLETLATLTFVQVQSNNPFLKQSGIFNWLIKGLVHMPMGGAVIGVLAALTAPLLWPAATKLCWTPEMRNFLLGGDDLTWLIDAYFQIAIPVGVPVGFLSGLSLHQVLRPVVLGVGGRSWYALSLPALAGVSGLCMLLYQSLLPGGSVKPTEELLWVRRMEPTSGEPISVNLATQEVMPSHARAKTAQMKMSAIEGFHFLRKWRDSISDLLASSSSEEESFATKPAVPVAQPLPKYKKDFVYHLEEVADAEVLYKLVDTLVRYKYLETKQVELGKEHFAAAMEVLNKDALESLGVKNIASLSKEVEKLCVLKKAVERDIPRGEDGSAMKQQQEVRTQVMKDVENKLLSHRPEHTGSSTFSFFGDSSNLTTKSFQREINAPCKRSSHPKVKGYRAISLLSYESIDILEDELQQKLGYVIQPLLEKKDEEKFIAEHHYEKRVEFIQKSLYYLSYSIVPLVGCYVAFAKK